MECAEFNTEIFGPAVLWAEAVPGWRVPFDDRANLQLLTIAGQEGDWTYRVQQGGPAHSFWQFEQGGGVKGVINHPASKTLVRAAMIKSGICPLLTEQEAYAAIAIPQGDGLACAFARLLLWTDPAELPDVGDVDGAWDYYQRNWRPGKPGPDRWPGNYAAARATLGL